ncbi:hypothetical protein MSPP1_002454 [Malassezia sp. CBS 17886]|nr:hypothetical protein MSPP1_002454 [Malassezia sp. CBS 17886]
MSAGSEDSLPAVRMRGYTPHPQLLNSVQSRLVTAQRQLGLVQAQWQGRQREAKLQELTYEQLKGMDSSTNTYLAVGRMFLLRPYGDTVAGVQEKQRAAQEESDALAKKRKARTRQRTSYVQFLEKQVADAQTHLTDLVKSIERANADA